MTLYRFVQRACCALLGLAMLFTPEWAVSQEGAPPMTISDGKQISMEYTLTLEDKTVVDTNVGQEPITFTQGSHNIIPGLEAALKGMTVGESKQVMVEPEQGYGPIDPQGLREVPIEHIPPDARKIGVQLQGKDNQGRMVRPRVTEVKEKTVVLDFNHPLAGKTLYFDVKIVDIKAASTSTP